MPEQPEREKTIKLPVNVRNQIELMRRVDATGSRIAPQDWRVLEYYIAQVLPPSAADPVGASPTRPLSLSDWGLPDALKAARVAFSPPPVPPASAPVGASPLREQTYSSAEMREVVQALWDMQDSPDCWCDAGDGAPLHSPACAYARDVTRKYKALAHGEALASSPTPPLALSLHRCKVCGARWLLWPDAVHGGGWNLLDTYQRPGVCCDNVPLGNQVEYLRDIPLTIAASRNASLDNIPEFHESAVAAEGGGINRTAIEAAIGFLSAPDRERVLERLGYTDADLAAYFRARGESSLPCLQPREPAEPGKDRPHADAD